MSHNFRRAAIAAAVTAVACTALPAWSIDLAEAYRLAREQDASIRASRAVTGHPKPSSLPKCAGKRSATSRSS